MGEHLATSTSPKTGKMNSELESLAQIILQAYQSTPPDKRLLIAIAG